MKVLVTDKDVGIRIRGTSRIHGTILITSRVIYNKITFFNL